MHGSRHLTYRQPSSHLKSPADLLTAHHLLQRQHRLLALSITDCISSTTAAVWMLWPVVPPQPAGSGD